MYKKILIVFLLFFTLLLSTQVNAGSPKAPVLEDGEIVTIYNELGYVEGFEYPISAHPAGKWVEYKWTTNVIYFDIYIDGNSQPYKIPFTRDEIVNGQGMTLISGNIANNDYEAIASISIDSIYNKISNKVVEDANCTPITNSEILDTLLDTVKNKGGKIGASADIGILKIKRNWETGEQIGQPEQIFNSSDLPTLLKKMYSPDDGVSGIIDNIVYTFDGNTYNFDKSKKSFSNTAISDIKKHFPFGKVAFPPLDPEPVVPVPPVVDGTKDLWPDNLKIYNEEGNVINKVEYGQNIYFTFDAHSTFEYELLGHNIEYSVSKLYADKTEKGKIINATTNSVNILPSSTGKFPNDYGLSNISFTVPNENDVKFIKIYAKIAEHIDENDKNNNELKDTAGGSGIIIPIDSQNLIAKHYVGDTNITTAKNSIKVGANVTALNFPQGIDYNVEFKVTLKNKDTGSTVGTYTFNKIINGNGNFDYTDENVVPNPGIGVYEAIVAVNPDGLNPDEDISDNTTPPATILVSPSGSSNGGGGGGSSIDLIIESYVGKTSVPTLQEDIQVKVRINNTANYTVYNENIIINFNNQTYDRLITLYPGEHEYNLGKIDSPQFASNYPIIITVNQDNNPNEGSKYSLDTSSPSRNRISANINVFEPNVPATSEPLNFDIALNLNGDIGETTTKAGYGIPIEIDITNFRHNYVNIWSDNDAYLDKTKAQKVNNYTNFDIKNTSKATLSSNTVKGFTFSRISDGEFGLSETPFEAVSAGGENATLKLTEVNGKRYIYTDPTLPDGDYEILVDVEIHATWEERYRWWNPHDSSRRTCGIPEHRHTDSCYEWNTDEITGEKVRGKRICGKVSHSHSGDNCSDQPSTIAESQMHTTGCYTYTGDWNYFWQPGQPIFEHQQLLGIIHIDGSMYDDDQIIISE